MPIVGYVQLDGVDIGEVTAIRTDPWAQAAARRMTDLGHRRAPRLYFHIEMKAIAMMIANGTRHGQVIINFAVTYHGKATR
ncbi:hypothetical protein [Actinokineospora cianjurensis]|uniref:Uncharacterized protein n=1 Tax=Actinokineospora cianjurensis TaxID=585224 RepID=A0A421BBG4_9PSEU|nr:hypothetical protein [Actinokineospora cianjurensis]RLK61704.1 hypothetical protein CLV68_2245 [Actinokineospora cianjurensis]